MSIDKFDTLSLERARCRAYWDYSLAHSGRRDIDFFRQAHCWVEIMMRDEKYIRKKLEEYKKAVSIETY